MTTIYKIVNTENNRMFIGYTSKKTPEEALVYWMRNCGKKIFAEYEIAKDVKKYGKGVFKAEYLTSAPTDSEAQEIVDRYIDTFNTLEPDGYNKSYAGIRKMNPNYYDNKEDKTIISIDNNLSIGEKTILEDEMRSLYGLDNLVTPTLKKNIATKEVIDGLRELANDLEKYGNIDVLSVIPRKVNDELENNGKTITKILDRRANLNLDKEYIITPSDSVLCTKCGKYKIGEVDFYSHIDATSTFDGWIHICKDCLSNYSEQIYEICKNPLYTMISISQITNVAFVQEVAERASEQWERNKDNPKEIAKYYFSELKFNWARKKDSPKTILEFRNSHFVGDIFSFEEYHPAMPKVFIKDLNQGLVKEKIKGDKTIVENLEQKWGKGFTAEEYESMEEEFNKLEKFLGKKTDLHIEALKKYIIYSSKEKTALAEGKDLKEVKEWSSLADKAAENAQLKIKQLSGDFGDGVDSFAQLAETVEEYYSAIPTLPKARKMPYDDMDFIIWQTVNYIRRLEGKPETSYEDVYYFYDEELTKKMRDSGMTDDQIEKAKAERNAVFKDLSDNYQEPLWLLPTLGEDEDDEGDEE